MVNSNFGGWGNRLGRQNILWRIDVTHRDKFRQIPFPATPESWGLATGMAPLSSLLLSCWRLWKSTAPTQLIRLSLSLSLDLHMYLYILCTICKNITIAAPHTMLNSNVTPTCTKQSPSCKSPICSFQQLRMIVQLLKKNNNRDKKKNSNVWKKRNLKEISILQKMINLKKKLGQAVN